MSETVPIFRVRVVSNFGNNGKKSSPIRMSLEEVLWRTVRGRNTWFLELDTLWSGRTKSRSDRKYKHRLDSDVDRKSGLYFPPRRLTLLEPQSHFGYKPLKFQVVCPQNGTAVLKGLKGDGWSVYYCCGSSVDQSKPGLTAHAGKTPPFSPLPAAPPVFYPAGSCLRKRKVIRGHGRTLSSFEGYFLFFLMRRSHLKTTTTKNQEMVFVL